MKVRLTIRKYDSSSYILRTNKTFRIKSFSKIEYKEITNSLNKEFITINENKSNESLSTIDQIRSISNKLREKS